MKEKEKYYITTTIPYMNDVPHIGFALEIIQADVLARYARLVGKKVFFLTGVDEHGTKIAKAAAARGMTSKAFVNQMSATFKELKKTLNLSWDDFIRTTDQRKHWPGVRAMWQRLVEAGDIYKKVYRGLYCSGCEAFLTDKDLVEGKCPLHNKEPELIEEENYFFRLSSYGKILRAKINSGEMRIVPDWRQREVLALIDEGLEDVSFSRSKEKLSWGIPVPGDDSQVLYVWADALTNYVSGIGFGRDEEKFSTWWPADVHVLGKDVLRFHAAIWPAMLLSAKLPLPKVLFVHGFLTRNGQKISKSLGNVLAPDEVVNRFGIDAARYYFLREVSPVEDGDYSDQRFVERYNADLANGLGNFCARVTGLVARRTTPVRIDRKKIELAVEQKIKSTKDGLDVAMREFRFNDALALVWDLLSFGDRYVNEKKPWAKENGDDKNEVALLNLLMVVQSVGVFLAPFLPDTAKKIAQSVVLKGKTARVTAPPPLFPRSDGTSTKT
jgi:methionyl-tRNA synthetase